MIVQITPKNALAIVLTIIWEPDETTTYDQNNRGDRWSLHSYAWPDSAHEIVSKTGAIGTIHEIVQYLTNGEKTDELKGLEWVIKRNRASIFSYQQCSSANVYHFVWSINAYLSKNVINEEMIRCKDRIAVVSQRNKLSL